jgi:hypothetical protein
VDSSDLGWLVQGSTTLYSYALVKLRERINWDADFTLHWKMQTDSVGTNGYLAFGWAANEAGLIRAGFDRQAGRLVITEPGSGGQSVSNGVAFANGVLDCEVAFAPADKSLTLRVGTNSLKRVLSANSSAITHIGYAVRQARTSFGFFEIDPAVKLAIKKFTVSPGGNLQFDVQIERGAPAGLILEKTAALGTPFITVTNSPQLFLGNKLFRFQNISGGGNAVFYRVRAQP